MTEVPAAEQMSTTNKNYGSAWLVLPTIGSFLTTSNILLATCLNISMIH